VIFNVSPHFHASKKDIGKPMPICSVPEITAYEVSWRVRVFRHPIGSSSIELCQIHPIILSGSPVFLKKFGLYSIDMNYIAVNPKTSKSLLTDMDGNSLLLHTLETIGACRPLLYGYYPLQAFIIVKIMR
jgi:hypothetical protein